MPLITLPDGSTRQYDQSVTVADVAASIGPGLAKAALAGRVDGQLVDTSFLIDDDADLAIVTERDEDGIEVLRHSCAHLMAQAVQRLFPSAQVTIGPVIEDGFFYDFSFERAFTPDDLAAIEKTMQEIVKENLPVGALGAFARRSNFAIQRNGEKTTKLRSSRASQVMRICHSIGRAISSTSVVVPTYQIRANLKHLSSPVSPAPTGGAILTMRCCSVYMAQHGGLSRI